MVHRRLFDYGDYGDSTPEREKRNIIGRSVWLGEDTIVTAMESTVSLGSIGCPKPRPGHQNIEVTCMSMVQIAYEERICFQGPPLQRTSAATFFVV